MTLTDRCLDFFTAEDLTKRARWVAAAGLLLCFAAVMGGAHLLRTTHDIAIEGTATWDGAQTRILEATFDPAALRRASFSEPLAIECLLPESGSFRSPVKVVEVDPGVGRLQLHASGIPEQLKAVGRFDIRLILASGSYGRFLWTR